jgi:hypothetical protein
MIPRRFVPVAAVAIAVNLAAFATAVAARDAFQQAILADQPLLYSS